MSKAPIALFVYDRPWHTRQAVEALQQNEPAEESDLFIFSDAPNSPGANLAVQKVREYIRGIGGFKSVTCMEREENLGLANSIIDGVTRLCNEYGRVIVLEDDLVVSPYFLEYMNEALERYRNNDKVMHICGYVPSLLPGAVLPETFFSRASSSWGWATWDDAWRKFEPDAESLLAHLRESGKEHEFDIYGSMPFTEMLERQMSGEIDSWAIRWYGSTFLLDGLCLHPSQSLVRNIGHDSSGVHCTRTNVFDVKLAEGPIREFPPTAIELEIGTQTLADFYRNMPRPVLQRLIRMMKRLFFAVK